MLSNQWQHSHDLYLAASVAMEVQNSISDWFVLLPEYDCADVAAIVARDCEVNAFEEMIVDELLPGANRVDIVLISIGCNDSSPRPLESLTQLFHNKK